MSGAVTGVGPGVATARLEGRSRAAAGVPARWLAAAALLVAVAAGPRVALLVTAGLAVALLARDRARAATVVVLGRDPAPPAGRLLARYDARAHRPREEVATALAGPLTLLLAGGLAAAGTAAAAPGSEPHRALTLLAGTVLLLAGLSLLPGLPLDGGRLVRAAAWRLTGSRVAGTRAAARVGRGTAAAVGLVTLSATDRRRPGRHGREPRGGRPAGGAALAGRDPARPAARAAGRAPAAGRLRARRRRARGLPGGGGHRRPPRVRGADLHGGLGVDAGDAAPRRPGARRPGDLPAARRSAAATWSSCTGPSGAAVAEEDLVKRVIGLPGERVAARDGTVTVDGVPLREPYAGRDCDAGPGAGRTDAGAGRAPLPARRRPLPVAGQPDVRARSRRTWSEGHIFGIVWPPGRTGRF